MQNIKRTYKISDGKLILLSDELLSVFFMCYC